MAYIAKEKVTEVTEAPVSREEYELFKEVEATKVDDTKVQIKQSIGTHTVAMLTRDKEQLEAEIVDLEAQIVEINAKLAAIENVSTPLVMEK